MNTLFSVIMIVDSGLAAYWSMMSLLKREGSSRLRYAFSFVAISSATWSLGFGLLYEADSLETAFYFRDIGMIGVFSFLICGLGLIGWIADIPHKLANFFSAISFIGILICYLTCLRGQARFYFGRWGIAYSLNPSWINNLYTLYSVFICILIFCYLVYMGKHAKSRRRKVLARNLLIMLLITALGMVIDTIMPMFGYDAIPGSSIAQFCGLCILRIAIIRHNQTETTISNISQFVYYSVSIPICVYDAKWKLSLYNDGAESFFKVPRTIAINNNMSISDFFEIDDDIYKFLGEEKSVIQAICKKNSANCVINIDKIRDRYTDIIGYIVSVDDITEHKKMMTELERANMAKTTFLANMSHEIRTPMNAIVGFSELLLKENLNSDQLEDVENIRDASYELLTIINGILDISKIEAGKMELVEHEYNLSDIIRSVIVQMKVPAEKKGLDFCVEIEPSLPKKLYGDSGKVREIMINLLSNAIKYTKNGSVTLKVRRGDLRDRVIEIAIDVLDTGIGIKKEDMASIFNSFESVDKTVREGIEGTGLGLPIVKGYIELMNGSINCESVYGEGSLFYVEIPQKIVDDTQVGDISMDGERITKSRISDVKFERMKVLVVDDNAVNLMVIKKSLINYGLEVDTASSGLAAINKCKDTRYSVIFMDQMMPEMDGIEAMKKIRELSGYYEKDGDCKIVALTANAVSGVREEMIEYGFDEYLSKPIEYDKLESFLDSIN